MSFVVSGNYRKEGGKKLPWLIRKTEHPIEGAVAVTSVHATGVEFRESPKGESGFGCNIVAICENATFDSESEIPAKMHMHVIKFDKRRMRFVKKHDRSVVTSCKRLILEPSGRIWAVFHDDEPAVDRYIGGAEEVPFTEP